MNGLGSWNWDQFIVSLDRWTYQNINLPTEDVLSLLKGVVSRPLRSGLNFIETRGEVSRRFGFGTNRMKVGSSRVLPIRQGDELVASALDDCERNQFAGHYANRLEIQYTYLVWTKILTTRFSMRKGTWTYYWWMQVLLRQSNFKMDTEQSLPLVDIRHHTREPGFCSRAAMQIWRDWPMVRGQ